MAMFNLQIVTPDGLLYDGEAEKIILRTTSGDVGILARHSDYVAPLGIGVARVFTPEGEKKAACAGGMVTVSDSNVKVVASTFEWSEQIDVERAERARIRAEEKLDAKKSQYEFSLAEIKLKKSLARISAAK